MPIPFKKASLGSVLRVARGRLLTQLVCGILFFCIAVPFSSSAPVAGYYFIDRPDGPVYISGLGVLLLTPVIVVFLVNGVMLSVQLIRAHQRKQVDDV